MRTFWGGAVRGISMDAAGPSASHWFLTTVLCENETEAPRKQVTCSGCLEPGDQSQTAPSFDRLQYLYLGLPGHGTCELGQGSLCALPLLCVFSACLTPSVPL